MKTFISANDLETLAAQGVRELTVDDDTILTAVAAEAAAHLGIKLVAPGAASPARSAVRTADVAGKPKGCQHGPLGGDRAPDAAPRVKTASQVEDQLIGAVTQLYRRGQD